MVSAVLSTLEAFAAAEVKSAGVTICVSEPTNMLDVRAILWLENYLQV